ncbi:MAG: hypothetical protein ACKOEZ_09190, partial [Spartobacteria bacterium]
RVNPWRVDLRLDPRIPSETNQTTRPTPPRQKNRSSATIAFSSPSHVAGTSIASQTSRQPGKFHSLGNPRHWTGFTA